MKNKGYRISFYLGIVLAGVCLIMSYSPRFVERRQGKKVPFSVPGDYEDAVAYGWPFPFWRHYLGDSKLNTFEHQVDIRGVALDAIFWTLWVVLACVPALFQFVMNCKNRIVRERGSPACSE